jgi:hypothetical protein
MKRRGLPVAVILMFLQMSMLTALSMPWTAQSKYLFTGATYEASSAQVSPYLDIYTGDAPYIIHAGSGELSVLLGLPLHRPTPFFFSFGTENQISFMDVYSRRTLFQSGSIGFAWDLLGDLSIDKYIMLSSRFDQISSAVRFYADSLTLEHALHVSTPRADLFTSLRYGLEEQSILAWSAGLDLRLRDSLALRLMLSREMELTIALGLSHYDPPADIALEYAWDYLGAHRGSMVRYPENTIPAFEYALGREDVSFIETDMNMTSDGGYVAVHDLSFLRYAGRLDAISELTLEQIRSFDMGSFYSREYRGLRALDLQETAEVLKPFAERGFVMLEAKLIGEGPEAMDRFLDAVRSAYAESTQVSYMTLYYENARLLPEHLHDDESWGLCLLNAPSLPPFALYSGFFFPLFAYEITDIVERYDPDYIMLTTDFIEYYDQAKELAADLGIDIMFWDFKDTIFALSADGGPGPTFL